MLAIRLQIDERSLKEASHILRAVPRALPRIMRRAMKRAVDSGATDLKRRVAEQIVVKKSFIAKQISKKWSSFSGSLGASAKRLPIPAFSVSRRAHGLSYRISRKGGRKFIEHGFLIDVVGGKPESTSAEARAAAFAKGGEELVREYSHHAIFARRGPKRLPIDEKEGPSIWWIITNTPGLLKAATDAAGEKIVKQIDDQISVELRRWQKR